MAHLPFATALVGRVAELSALTAQLETAQAGRGSIVLLTGAAGIGKSRLARELTDLAERRSMNTMWGRSFEGEATRSFAPWVEALGGYARRLTSDQLLQQLGQHASVVARIVPAVRDALADHVAPLPSSAVRIGSDLFDAIVPFALSVAKQRPLVLVFDDLQWADRASLALLRHLARQVSDSAMLVALHLPRGGGGQQPVPGGPVADAPTRSAVPAGPVCTT